MIQTVKDLVLNKRVIVCCGAGGVGKTTIATGLALAGARQGRRVLALTIDPSRRLADTLGVSRNLWAPVAIPAERLEAIGIGPPGGLDAWMLDPQLVADRVVRRLAPNPETARRLMNNRIYKHVSEMIAGMQEYTAMEALYGFLQEDRFDLIILDTPPSRNALDFLEGPGRLERFFDGRIFRLFAPSEEEEGFLRRAASTVIGKVLSTTFGDQTYEDMMEFFRAFADIFHLLNNNAKEMRTKLSQEGEAAFLLVTSPAPEALTEALFFKQKTDAMGLPFRGFVLNRSQAYLETRLLPSEIPPPPDAPDTFVRALEKLQHLAELEQAQERRDRRLLQELESKAGDDAFAVPLPTLSGGVDDLPSLLSIANALMG